MVTNKRLQVNQFYLMIEIVTSETQSLTLAMPLMNSPLGVL